MQRIQPDTYRDVRCYLCTLIVVTDAEGTFLTETVSPEALDGGGASIMLEQCRSWLIRSYLLCHGVVSKEEPETKDWFSKHVKDGIGDNLGVDVNISGSVSNTPDAVID